MSTLRLFQLSRGILLGATALFACTGNAQATEWQTVSVAMVGVENQMAETCLTFEPGQKISYRYHSQHPLNFNIHYHSADRTEFLSKHSDQTTVSGEFTSTDQPSYCFAWLNRHDLQQQTWQIQLHYQTSPL